MESVFAIGGKEAYQFVPLCGGEAGTYADVLQSSGDVEEAEKKGADVGAFAVLVPAKSGDDTVAVALVFDLELAAFVGSVDAGEWLGNEAVEAGAFETAEPVLGDGAVRGCGCEVERRLGVA